VAEAVSENLHVGEGDATPAASTDTDL
jgi:hypothetical protein